MHPAHVPLHAEADAAGGSGGGDARPCGGLLGDHHDAGVVLVRGGGGLLEEVDGLQVLASAVDVRAPMAGFAAVVEVEHGADGIHAQCIDVQVLKPEQGVGHQEVAYFAASEVEHIGAPFRVFAAQRVRVLVQRGAVEAAEREGILREVGGHPVHDHADAGLMELVDQVTEVVGGTETGVDRIVAGDLIAPGAGERVLGQWHELHVGEAFLLDVVHELLGQVAVVSPCLQLPACTS